MLTIPVARRGRPCGKTVAASPLKPLGCRSRWVLPRRFAAASCGSIAATLIAFGLPNWAHAEEAAGAQPASTSIAQPAPATSAGTTTSPGDEPYSTDPIEVRGRPVQTTFDDDLIVVPTGNLRYRFELKRQNTNVRSPSATSRTIARIEHFPKGDLSLVRVEVPFPDENSSGGPGNGFNPHVGDTTFRLDWKGMRLSYWHLSPFIELTFPTANPESLGTGKYQVAPGVYTDVPLLQTRTGALSDVWSWGVLAQQVMSVAGDPDKARISYLKFELALVQGWRDKYTLKTTLKPTIDWMANNKTGGVVEVEGGMRLADRWRLTLMVGAGLWGVGIPNTYNERTELTLGYEF